MPNILALAGSPRCQGNSGILLEHVIKGSYAGGGQVEKLILNEMKIAPCQECGGCDKTGCCAVNDDMQSIYPKLDEAAALIVASPIFFSGISAQTKALIDRCQCHWIRKYILHQSPHPKKRPGIFLSVRGQIGFEIFQFAAKPIKAFFATEDVSYSHGLFADNIDSKGKITAHPEILDAAYKLGQQLLLEINKS